MSLTSIGFLALFLFVACADPVHDAEVDALGPEAPGVPAGPDHRPGQPCLTCHGGQGPSSFEMAFGGTVFAYLASNQPAGGATIHLLDGAQHTFTTQTNCAGNFWVPKPAFEPMYPVQAAVQWVSATEVMRTEMRLNGDCNSCHVQPENAGSPGHTWILAPSTPVPEVSCR
jgi:hypothetical protein